MLNMTRKTKAEIKAIEASWPRLSEYVFLPANEKEYDRLVDFMNYLLDRIESEDNPSLEALLHVVGTLVSDYERTHHEPIEKASPLEMLEFYMNRDQLKQSDLADVFGGQGNVSKVLRGERKINAGHARKLAERFQVSAAMFI
jgi:HTH-type transcriptional regulator / antitoxin HigA